MWSLPGLNGRCENEELMYYLYTKRPLLKKYLCLSFYFYLTKIMLDIKSFRNAFNLKDLNKNNIIFFLIRNGFYNI